eukprot:TRINITY_DN4277_c0_g1_i3.p1 TRINITY_DN4277_c0_g1~~TRINITY_DN4277_c0_g1_i3.p1  ORF type:complete len:153 (-),score=52.28 TRINITY_DN4277_c0_g1_i3:50-508(-)
MRKKVEKVKLSHRIRETPAVVVTSQYGWSANMERIMKAKALGETPSRSMSARKTLEINPKHPMIVELKSRIESSPSDSSLKNTAQLIYDSALMSSGFTHDDPLTLVRRIHTILAKDLGVQAPEEDSEETAGSNEDFSEDIEVEDEAGFHDEL